MLTRFAATEYRPFRVIRRLARGPEPAARIFRAGERAEPGLYREIERGVTLTLTHTMPLPDLNSHQPSRFFRQTRAGWLARWLLRRDGYLDQSRVFLAGQHAPAGSYWELERWLLVRLVSDGPLPDLQSQQSSGYRRIKEGKYVVRRK
jgi:hypothetical protein